MFEPRVLDYAERLFFGILLSFLALRLIPKDPFTWQAAPQLFILAVEAIVVGFLVFRRHSTDVSQRWQDWLLGLVGTTAPLLAEPTGSYPLAPPALCLLAMLAGLILNFWAKLSLRRSFGIVAANRGVKTDGPYRFLRHPMYAGYVVTHIGYLAAGPTSWNTVIYITALGCQIMRIKAEERILSRDPSYQKLMEQVPYRLVPRLY